MEENNTGGWRAPADLVAEMHAAADKACLEIPMVSIARGGVLYPMPQLDAAVAFEKDHWWQPKKYFVLVRQYGQDKMLYLGPYRTKGKANKVKAEIYAWYTDVYNVIIRTYKATERNRK